MEKRQITNIKVKREEVAIVNKRIRDYYEQLYVHIFSNLDEMDKFLF